MEGVDGVEDCSRILMGKVVQLIPFGAIGVVRVEDGSGSVVGMNVAG